ASITPEGLNRASVANPAYAVCAPCESAMTLLMGEIEGVASKVAVKVPVSVVERAAFCQRLLPPVAVKQPWARAAPATAMLIITSRHTYKTFKRRCCIMGSFPLRAGAALAPA